MNVRGRTLSAIAALFIVLFTAAYVLGTVDRGTAAPSQFAGWTGYASSINRSDSAAMTPDDDVAVRLLAKSAHVSTRLSFNATVTSWTPLGARQVSITHRAGRGTWVIDAGSTQRLVEGSTDSFTQAGKSLSLLATNYRVIRDASRDKVIAHRPTAAVNALDTQGRTVARFWIDPQTGLLIGKDAFTVNGSVRASFEFTALEVVRGSFAPAPTQTDSWGQAIDADQLQRLRRAGCGCPDALPENLSLLETHVSKAATVGGGAPAIHQVFSDGIAAVSLFVVPGSLNDQDAQSLRSAGFHMDDAASSGVWVRAAGTTDDSWTAVWVDRGHIVTAMVSGSVDDQRTLEMIVSAESPTVSLGESTVMGRVMLGWQRLVGLLA